jgi:DNA anti-recombination protein RmuC
MDTTLIVAIISLFVAVVPGIVYIVNSRNMALKTDAKIDRLAASVDERFDKVYERFDKVDEHFEKLEAKYDERFAQTDAQLAALSAQVSSIRGNLEGEARTYHGLQLLLEAKRLKDQD